MIIVDIKDRKILNPATVRGFFESLKDGKHIIKSQSGSLRSINLNAYYWVLCELLVDPLRGLGWEMHDSWDVHQYMAGKFLSKLVLNEKTNEFYRSTKSTSSLSGAQMMDYVNSIRQFVAEGGIQTPDPQ